MKKKRSRLLRFSVTVALLGLALAANVSCKKHESVRDHSNPKGGPLAAQFDVCGLITNAELEAVIQSQVKETKPSGRADMGLRVSQCYYMAAESSKSVSLAVTDQDPTATSNRSALVYWEETFGQYEKEEEAEKQTESDKEKKESLREQKREGEEEERQPPKKIAGVGDEAFWSGNRVGGALYVLKKDKKAFIRISVGGPDDEEKKIEKSKALALKALEHL